MRYFLEVAYQGTLYHGWQVQLNAASVQGTLQARLAQLLRREVKIVGSGRTDAGVHARQQFAHLDLDAGVDVCQLMRSLNATLPPDIAVAAVRPVRPTAHARFDAVARTYHYTVLQVRDPFRCQTSYLLYRPLDVAKMNEAAAHLCGLRDFEGFSKAHTDVAHSVCTVMEAAWDVQAQELTFRIRANRFLRGMVRFIVSHLLQVGVGQLSVGDFENLLARKTRHDAARLVPACGLTLMAVSYPDTVFAQSEDQNTLLINHPSFNAHRLEVSHHNI